MSLHRLSTQLPKEATRWWVALSGGVDSCVLLQQLAVFQKQLTGIELGAIHVHHGLSPNADQWASHCERICKELDIPLAIQRVSIEQQSRQGLEQLARQARWRALFEVAAPDDVIWLGHHQDDQVETLMLKLLRGSGVLGAGAMYGVSTQQSRYVLRPLLDLPKSQLIEIARQAKLGWVEDESNTNTEFARNFLRQNVFPVVETEWPGYRSALSRFAEHMQQSQRLLEQLAEQDWHQANRDGALSIAEICSLNIDRQSNLIRYWVSQRAHYLPNAKALQNFLEQLNQARTDSRVQLDWGTWRIQQSGDSVHLIEKQDTVAAEFRLLWDSYPEELVINAINNRLRVNELAADKDKVGVVGVRPPNSTEKVWVCSRVGGERCWPQGRSKTTQLKKVFQELSVPNWQRDRIPLVFYNDQLVAAVGLFYDRRFLSNDKSAITFELVTSE